MTYPTAPAFPGLTESVLGPILIGITTPSHDLQALDEVWRTAADSIPTTMPLLNVTVEEATQAQQHRRRVLTGHGSHYLKLARLCDIRGNEPVDESWERWRWTVAAKIAPDDGGQQLVGSSCTPIRVDVISCRLEAGKVLEAQQLALFRHYVVVGFQAIDSRAVVVGGQHDWHDNWWPIAQP